MTNTFKEMKTSRYHNSQHAGVVEQAGQVDVFKKKQRKRNVAISWSETQGTFCNMTFDLTNNQTSWVSQSEGPDWATYRKRLTINNNNQKWFHHIKTHTHTSLTAVDSLEASVISRLPLSPSRAGTRMNTSETSVNTVQCCNNHNTTWLQWTHGHTQVECILCLGQNVSGSLWPSVLIQWGSRTCTMEQIVHLYITLWMIWALL